MIEDYIIMCYTIFFYVLIDTFSHNLDQKNNLIIKFHEQLSNSMGFLWVLSNFMGFPGIAGWQTPCIHTRIYTPQPHTHSLELQERCNQRGSLSAFQSSYRVWPCPHFINYTISSLQLCTIVLCSSTMYYRVCLDRDEQSMTDCIV